MYFRLLHSVAEVWTGRAGAEWVGLADSKRQVGATSATAEQWGGADPLAHLRVPGRAGCRAECAADGLGRPEAVAVARFHAAQGRPARDLQVLFRLGLAGPHQLQMIVEYDSRRSQTSRLLLRMAGRDVACVI